MKYRVVGWTFYGSDKFKWGEDSFAAQAAIIDEIRKNNYKFSGYVHQECFNCTPVLNDGKQYCYSQRGFGSIMAEAYGYNDVFDYAKFSFDTFMDDEKRPSDDCVIYSFEPETNLNEEFCLDNIDYKKENDVVVIDDIAELRYINVNDTVVINNDKYLVTKIKKHPDIEKKELDQLYLEIMGSDEKHDLALKKLNEAKIVIELTLKLMKK